MEILTISDRSALENYFRRDLSLHFYSLGDLDDFYWPQTTVYGTRDEDGLKNITPLYRGEGQPVLLALGALDPEFLGLLQTALPDHFYAHLSPGFLDYFSKNYRIREYGDHFKMTLMDPGPGRRTNIKNTFRLTEANLSEINQLYQESYPGNAFDPRMLLTGHYFGIRRQERLVSIAGVHVYSAYYRVAALGNITTHPQARGMGYGKAVTARLCQHLGETADFIGLNVKCDNQPALDLYQTLGFRISAEYGEFSLQKQA